MKIIINVDGRVILDVDAGPIARKFPPVPSAEELSRLAAGPHPQGGVIRAAGSVVGEQPPELTIDIIGFAGGPVNLANVLRSAGYSFKAVVAGYVWDRPDGYCLTLRSDLYDTAIACVLGAEHDAIVRAEHQPGDTGQLVLKDLIRRLDAAREADGLAPRVPVTPIDLRGLSQALIDEGYSLEKSENASWAWRWRKGEARSDWYNGDDSRDRCIAELTRQVFGPRCACGEPVGQPHHSVCGFAAFVGDTVRADQADIEDLTRPLEGTNDEPEAFTLPADVTVKRIEFGEFPASAFTNRALHFARAGKLIVTRNADGSIELGEDLTHAEALDQVLTIMYEQGINPPDDRPSRSTTDMIRSAGISAGSSRTLEQGPLSDLAPLDAFDWGKQCATEAIITAVLTGTAPDRMGEPEDVTALLPEPLRIAGYTLTRQNMAPLGPDLDQRWRFSIDIGRDMPVFHRSEWFDTYAGVVAAAQEHRRLGGAATSTGLVPVSVDGRSWEIPAGNYAGSDLYGLFKVLSGDSLLRHATPGEVEADGVKGHRLVPNDATIETIAGDETFTTEMPF